MNTHGSEVWAGLFLLLLILAAAAILLPNLAPHIAPEWLAVLDLATPAVRR